MDEPVVLGCALNLSEGRNQDLVDSVVAAASREATVLDVHSDADHNRTVVTMCGQPARLIEAVVKISGTALPQTHLSSHRGVHPRTGTVDVVPFYPLLETAMALAIDTARRCAARLWWDLGIPSFLYEQAALPEPRPLPWVRKHAFVDLYPDHGGPEPHPTAGATVVGARGLLVAYNVNLVTADLAVARRIAAKLRKLHPDKIRTLGLYLDSRRMAQVSTNIIAPERLTLKQAFTAVLDAARDEAVRVHSSEIVGLVPRACRGTTDGQGLFLPAPPKILEEEVDRLCGG